jgi:hypothetical protein
MTGVLTDKQTEFIIIIMKTVAKDTHLQIRLSKAQKALIFKSAKTCGKDVSKWVLEKILLDKRKEFFEICKRLSVNIKNRSFSFAELSDFLFQLSKHDFSETLSYRPDISMSDENWNIISAMIENIAHKNNFPCPSWVRDVPPLENPLFATELTSLKTYLLINAPIAFRKRNIFVDASVGDRV